MVHAKETIGKKFIGIDNDKKFIIPSWIPFTCESEQLILSIGESIIDFPYCNIQYSINDIMNTFVLSDQIILYFLQEKEKEQNELDIDLLKSKTIKNFWKWTFNLTWFIRKKYFYQLSINNSFFDVKNILYYNNSTISFEHQNEFKSITPLKYEIHCLFKFIEYHKNICAEMSQKKDINIMNDKDIIIAWWIVSVLFLELINKKTNLIGQIIFDSILKDNNNFENHIDILPLSFNKIQFIYNKTNPCSVSLVNNNIFKMSSSYGRENSIVMHLGNNYTVNDYNSTDLEIKSCQLQKKYLKYKNRSTYWSKNVNDYEIIKPLGKGSGGFVRKAIYKKTGQKVIIKYVIKSLVLRGCWISEDDENKKLPSEIYILKKLSNLCGKVPDFIQNLLTYWEDQIYYYLVFSDNTYSMDLFDYIDKIPEESMPEDDAKNIFKNIVEAIQFLHHNNIVHRDIKDENILIDINTKKIQIIDFGSSAYYNSEKKFNTFVGSLVFAAPEIIKGLCYSGPSQDIWSLGILLYTMIHKVTPFSNYFEILRNTPVFNEKISSECKDLILWMTNHEATKRPNIDQVLNHKWFL